MSKLFDSEIAVITLSAQLSKWTAEGLLYHYQIIPFNI